LGVSRLFLSSALAAFWPSILFVGASTGDAVPAAIFLIILAGPFSCLDEKIWNLKLIYNAKICKIIRN
jgi:hypothetical protein